MRPALRCALPLLLLTALALPGGQPAARATTVVRPLLELVPLDGKAVRLELEDWDRLPRQTLTVEFPAGHAHQAGRAEVSGFPLHAFLPRLGVPEGDLHGRWLRRVVVVEAADGYKVVFTLAELAAGAPAGSVLLVDRRDGKGVGDEEGPLRLVVPAERHPSRWVRQVVRIALREVG